MMYFNSSSISSTADMVGQTIVDEWKLVEVAQTTIGDGWKSIIRQEVVQASSQAASSTGHLLSKNAITGLLSYVAGAGAQAVSFASNSIHVKVITSLLPYAIFSGLTAMEFSRCIGEFCDPNRATLDARITTCISLVRPIASAAIITYMVANDILNWQS